MNSAGNIPVISVGIVSEKNISFELYGDFRIAGVQEILSGRFTASISGDRIIIKRGTDKYEYDNEVIIVPVDPELESFLLKDVVIGKGFHWERKEKQRFSGSLKLIKNGDKIEAINIIPLETYLVSVISSEMSAKASIELLKTHAVISRSWFLAQIEKSKAEKPGAHKTSYEMNDEIVRWYDREDHILYDVCADDHCQRYQGITKIVSDTARQAIEQTTGMVLLSGNTICDTRYSKACGGITESFENIWEPVKHDYLSSVVDYKFEPENFNVNFTIERNAQKWIKGNPHAFCNTNDRKILSQVLQSFDQQTSDFFRWKIEYTQAEISDIIKKKSGIDFGSIVDLIPLERGFSSRIIRLKISGTKRSMIIGKELEIRKVLAKKHLYSSAFIVEKGNEVDGVPEKFTIYGAGWGHGAGLCQIGAAVMAEMGYHFDEILLHYFSNVKLQRIY